MFTKEFTLDIPKGLDVHISINFESLKGKSDDWRGTFWVRELGYFVAF